MDPLVLLFLLLVAVPSIAFSPNILQIQGSAGLRSEDSLYCDSWRLSVETNNAGSWAKIPARCLGFVNLYMNGERYDSDSQVAAADAISFARSLRLAGDGLDAWIFDVDETLLSNLPYYEDTGYGSEIFNETKFDEWLELTEAPVLPASLKLYKELQQLGFSLILLTGRSEAQRNSTEKNLLIAGFRNWERLILREASDIGKHAVIYKSEKRSQLEGQGFRIHGNSGDQWSDLLGASIASRSFKLPNPMYYVA